MAFNVYNENIPQPALKNTEGLSKRTALGVLNSNQSFKRAQQSKIFSWLRHDGSSKNENENLQNEISASTKFNIFQDENDVEMCGESRTPELAAEISKLICDSTGSTKENVNDNREIQSPDNEEPLNLEETKRDYLNWTCPFRDDVLQHMKKLEANGRPHPFYIYKQKDINVNMRKILVDWMVEVGEEYKLESETVHLAVSYTDRFLSKMAVMRDKLQLVGTAALFTASKFEEIYPPELKEFAYITDSTYTKKQIIRMEHLLLEVLDFGLAPPTVFSFCHIFCGINSASEMVSYLAQYFCDLSMLDADPFLNFLPSEIAAACLALANNIFGCPVWPNDMKSATGYDLEDIKVMMHCLYKVYSNVVNNELKAIREKFSSSKFRRVAEIPCPTQLNI